MLVTHDQIRCENVQPSAGLIDQLQINILRKRNVVEGLVSIGLYKGSIGLYGLPVSAGHIILQFIDDTHECVLLGLIHLIQL